MKHSLLAFVLMSCIAYASPTEQTPWKIVEGDCVSEVVRQGGSTEPFSNPLQLTRGSEPLLATVTEQYVAHQGGKKHYELKVYRAHSKEVVYSLPLTYGVIRPQLHSVFSELPNQDQERNAALFVSMNGENLLKVIPVQRKVSTHRLDKNENIVSIIAHPKQEGHFIVGGYRHGSPTGPSPWFTHLVDSRLSLRVHSEGISLGNHATTFVKGDKSWVAGLVRENSSSPDKLQIFSVDDAKIERTIELGDEYCALSVFYRSEKPAIAISCFNQPLVVFDPLEGKQLFNVPIRSLGLDEMYKETRYPTPSFTHDGKTYLLAIARSSVTRGGIGIVNAKTGTMFKFRTDNVSYSGRAWVIRRDQGLVILVQDDNYYIHAFDRNLDLLKSIPWHNEVTHQDEAVNLYLQASSN